jgi:cytochrome c553
MSPKIIGQKKAYLAAKLRDFRELKRVNPYMNGVVAELTNQDIDNLAAYYANYGQGKK